MAVERDLDRAAGREADGPGRQRLRAVGPGAALLRLATAAGNAALGRLARQGAGLLPGGAVHPDVEVAIAARRGAGSSLEAGVRDRVGPALGDPLADVRVHADTAADELARSVSARAFTTGTDVFFARDEYRPGTSSGDELLTHELTHVVQQRGAPVDGPLTVSQPGDAMEREAEAATRDLSGG
jgi:hypothetical protein